MHINAGSDIEKCLHMAMRAEVLPAGMRTIQVEVRIACIFQAQVQHLLDQSLCFLFVNCASLNSWELNECLSSCSFQSASEQIQSIEGTRAQHQTLIANSGKLLGMCLA